VTDTTTAQTYASHRRYVPLYHYVASTFLLANLVYATWTTVSRFSVDRVIYLLAALALVLLFWYTRAFALGVQDRVIRLEERLRLARLLPNDLGARIDEFSMQQLIGLRFASDAELPELARRVLQERLDRETIKRAVRDWRADHHRI
jgi:hypothetical protein